MENKMMNPITLPQKIVFCTMAVYLFLAAISQHAAAEESKNTINTMNIFANNGRSFASLSDVEVEALSAPEKQAYDVWNKAQLEAQAKQTSESGNARTMQTLSSDFAF